MAVIVNSLKKYIFLTIFLTQQISFSADCKWPELKVIDKGSLVSTYTFYFWRFAKKINTYLPQDILQEGYVAGDYQFNNINIAYSKNDLAAKFVVSDLDDAGQAVLIGDYVKFVSYLYEQYGNIKDKTMLRYYIKGLKSETMLDEDIPMGIKDLLKEGPKYFQLSDEIYADRKVDKKNNLFEKKQDLIPISNLPKIDQEAVSSALIKLSPVKALDIGFKINSSGSGIGLMRTLFLLKPKEKYQIYELKEERCSAVNEYKKQDSSISDFSNLAFKLNSEEYWQGSYIVENNLKKYLLRPKKQNQIELLNLNKLSESELEEYENYFSYYLGLLHSKQVPSSYVKYIDSHIPEVSQKIKTMSKDFLNQLKRDLK